MFWDIKIQSRHADMSKIRFSFVGIDTWFIRDRDLGRVWDWDWDLGSEISEKSPEISENIARDRDFPYIISEKLPRFGRDWYFSCIAAWISTRWLYFYRENIGKNGRDLWFRGHDVIYSGPRWTCLVQGLKRDRGLRIGYRLNWQW